MTGPSLERVYNECMLEQSNFLKNDSRHGNYGRAVTGDGSTIMGTKFINTLVHEFGKGAMLLNITDCTKRLQEVGTIDVKFIASRLIQSIQLAGPKSVVLVIVDGGADWVAAKSMVQYKFPWISFMHCVGHEASLIVKDLCKITEIKDLLDWITDAQHWFSTGKVGPLLQGFCKEHYQVTRHFVWPAETRFAAKLLQIKRFLCMEQALKSTVQSAQYIRFSFVNDTFKDRICDDNVWRLMRKITNHAGPLLLLLRLADSNKATLSKLKATVDKLKTKFVDFGRDSLTDKIAVAFINRAPELECDISSAAYVLDPQFVLKSRNAPREVMIAFWRITRKVLRLENEDAWNLQRPLIVSELSNFRMKTGGFGCEDYNVKDCCAFWGVAGCHAPNLKKLAFLLTSLPCSSGEAERNWKEVKLSLTKRRNRINTDKLVKMVFVRRFLKMKKKICFGRSNDGFKEWAQEVLDKVRMDETGSSSSSAEENDDTVFVDHIEPGEQLKINGMLGEKRKVKLTMLKKDNVSKSWLYRKYYNMHFVDKSPDDLKADSKPLEESEWEHRVIKDIQWFRGVGWLVETFLKDGISNQSIEYYNINEKLHDMIRDSPHNVRSMSSKVREDEMDEDETDGDGGEDESNTSDSSGSDSDSDDRVPVSSLFDH